MSSRSKTKSLDRDISQRKRKTNYPQNVQKVCNAAEHIICHFHNQIEEIYNLYPINQFRETLLTEKIGDLLDGINVDSVDLSSVTSELKERSNGDGVTRDLLLLFIDFVSMTLKLLDGISNRMSQTIIRGLILYCVSLADYCSSEIAFVVNYEKIIQKNSPDIVKEVKDIEKEVINLTKGTATSRAILYHSSEVIEYVGKIRACINKLYYLVTEWVDEERAYATNLTEEMKLVKSQMFAIQQRTDVNKDSLVRRQERLVGLEKHIAVLRKNENILRRKHRRVKNSQQQIETMIKQLENQVTFRDTELAVNNKKVDRLKNKPKRKDHQNLYKDNEEINVALSEQRELKSKRYRLDDNRLALDRHRERLDKVDQDLGERIMNVERQIQENESLKSKLQSSLKEDVDAQTKDLERLKELRPIMSDLNFLYSRKNSPETLRQLRNHGKLIIETKDVNLIDKMCERVARAVPESWRELYLNLPFYPSRSDDQRSKDIEVIDLVSARNHNTPIKQARMSLNKWRLFYHNATPEHLIEGLRKSHLTAIAKDIEEVDAKSKQRFED